MVGIFSVRVARREEEASKDRKEVPVFGSVFDCGVEDDVGGQIICVAATNSRMNPPFGEGKICSCHICFVSPDSTARQENVPVENPQA